MPRLPSLLVLFAAAGCSPALDVSSNPTVPEDAAPEDVAPEDLAPIEPIDPVEPAPHPEIEACSTSPSEALDSCDVGVAAVAGGVTFGSVQAAIDSGAGRVEVCPGLHAEALLADTSLELRSASGDPADTVLSGSGVHTVLVASAPVQVAGLTFSDGFTVGSGGGISATAGLTVDCSVFTGSFADYEGGAILASGPFAVRGSAFRDNVAGYAGGAIARTGSTVGRIQKSVFEGNSSGYEGGAVQLRGHALVESSRFAANTADYEGGGISWGDWTDAQLRVVSSTFEGNSADYSGGAIEIGTWAHADVVDILSSQFVDNHDGVNDGVVSFDSWGGFVGTIDGCDFQGNDVAIGANGWLLDGYALSVTNTNFVGPSGVW